MAPVESPPISSFVRKCAHAAFERAVEPLHSAISSFRPLNSSFPRRRESRGECGGLVARWGGVARTLPPTNATRFAYLGVPAPAGMSDCYESSDVPDSRFRHPNPAPRHSSSKRRRPESRRGGEGECSAGACPQLRAGWKKPTSQNRRARTAFSSSYAALPQPAWPW